MQKETHMEEAQEFHPKKKIKMEIKMEGEETVSFSTVVSRTVRDEPPTHFQLRIKSFSLLSNSSLKIYHSDVFQAGGYKWRLCLYPSGNEDVNGGGHISLYLLISEIDSLPPGWEVHALLRLFVLDQFRDKFLTLQDGNGRPRRFRATNTQSGFDRLITLEQFKNSINGYLVNDTCVFGAEVFVHKESVAGKGECLSMTSKPVSCNHTWTIKNFSKLDQKFHYSDTFSVGGHIWRVVLYPSGDEGIGKSLSLFLELTNCRKTLPDRGVYVEYQLRVMNQLTTIHMKKQGGAWFNDSSKFWGWREFLSLSNFRDGSKGYLVKDACIIEASIQLIGEIGKLD